MAILLPAQLTLGQVPIDAAMWLRHKEMSERSGVLVDRDWRKSQRCCEGPDCVEVAWDADGVWLRDSKNAGGPVLRFSRSDWAAFIAGVRYGEFDAGAVSLTTEPETNSPAA